MCGFGDKDRRPIDPPPVVRVFVSLPDGTPVPESSIDYSMMMVHASLWSEDRTEERSLVINPSIIPCQSPGSSSSIMTLNPPPCTRSLVGHCTSSAYLLKDHMDQLGIYFIFQDLSVRTEGTYTLKFSFCDIKGLFPQTCNGFSKIRGNVAAEAYSASFRIYSAKKFPGMTESTALSKAFASQGIKLTIRKDFRCQRVNNDHLLDQINEVIPPNPNNALGSVESNDHEDDDRKLSDALQEEP